MLFDVILAYFLIINLITFVVWGVDKRKSIKHKWRISEKQLLIFCALGGFLGAIAGMSVWHHKTIKSQFLWKFWLIVFMWIIFLSLMYYLNSRY